MTNYNPSAWVFEATNLHKAHQPNFPADLIDADVLTGEDLLGAPHGKALKQARGMPVLPASGVAEIA
jgi:hypothetical protein